MCIEIEKGEEAHNEDIMKKTGFAKVVSLVAVFSVATAVASYAQTFTLLDTFEGHEGVLPNGDFVQGYNGNFYETTQGGPQDSGNILEITPAGGIRTLYDFCLQANCPDGSYPIGGLALAPGGNFYGATYNGTLFEVTPTGKLTTLYTFCANNICPHGYDPEAGLTLGANGNFYGTTFYTAAGYAGGGTLFEITPQGTLTTLYSFCSLANCADGSQPIAAVVQGADGNIYGTTYHGGTHDAGTVFKYTPAGKLITLYSLTNPNGVPNPGPCGLMQATDGTLYGFRCFGGKAGFGSIFKISTSGKFTTLYNFCLQAGCLDGADPAALLQGTDGNFYGTTTYGGRGLPCIGPPDIGCGTIFEMTPEGKLTTLYSFCTMSGCPDGAGVDPISLATDGIFYGTTFTGGSSGLGTIYSFATGLTPFVEANPNFSKAGRPIAILGNGLTGTTSVTFNGISATFTVEADTLIKATVPDGTTSGTIEVTTPSGTLNSNVAFQVLP
jgi:uncharacterized repeat protein (TIGR03803 family)